MQFSVSFSFLLASVLFILSTSVEARPAVAGDGVITFPLKRLEQRSNLHPSLLLHRQMSNSLRRMGKRQEPALDALADELLKRNTPTGSYPIAEYEAFFNNSYRGKITPSVVQNHNGTGNVFISALNNIANDFGYVADVQIGTPFAKYTLLIDTASSYFWVGAEGCVSNSLTGTCGNHAVLGYGNSQSYIENGTMFNITDPRSNEVMMGKIVNDTVVFDGLILMNYTFGVLTNETARFASDFTPYDGVLGLGPSENGSHILTIVEKLYQAGVINEATVSYKLSRASDNDGEIALGGLDMTKVNASTLVKLPNLNTNGKWEANIASISAGSNMLNTSGQRTAIFDTGSPLITIPHSDALALFSFIPEASQRGNGWIINCTTRANVSLNFGGQNFDINSTDLLYLPVDPNHIDGPCFTTIVSSNQTSTQWILGTAFLKNIYFTTYGFENNSVSLAQLA